MSKRKTDLLARAAWKTELSLALFSRPHICRRCYETFIPLERGRIYLCPVCDAIPYAVRRREIEIRSQRKKRGELPPKKERPVLPKTDTLPESQSLEAVDRSTRPGFLKYYTARSWHFSDAFGVPCTRENMLLVFRRSTL